MQEVLVQKDINKCSGLALETLERLKVIYNASVDKQAADVLILELRGLTVIADYFIICSADNPPQMKAIMENIEKRLKEHNVVPLRIEGQNASRWVLMDYNDIIVHVFDKQTRSYYNLERLWLDASRISLVENGNDPYKGNVLRDV